VVAIPQRRAAVPRCPVSVPLVHNTAYALAIEGRTAEARRLLATMPDLIGRELTLPATCLCSSRSKRGHTPSSSWPI
jgi:hypothetical protein